MIIAGTRSNCWFVGNFHRWIKKARVFQQSRRTGSSNFVKIVEVGPRDGLQNEPRTVPTKIKVELINKLSETGLKRIEITSFVSPKWVPQMADNSAVCQQITKKPGVSYSVLVPNMHGLDNAIRVGVKEIAIFGAASETFSKRNINASISESIVKFGTVLEEAKKRNVKVRGYVSCVAGCPYEGDTAPKLVATLSAAMLELGCYEVSLGDTIGVGTPRKFRAIFNELKSVSSNAMQEFAVHCHDTYGQALVNIYESLECGIRVFDSSVAGLGGCPYAAGASGNVATEDVLYFLNGQGIETGIDFNKIVDIGDYISKQLGRRNQSKTGIAHLAKRCPPV